MDIIDCSGWNFCNHCKSDKYIIDYFPKGHWAYTVFKTKNIRIFQQHESTKDHMKHFEKYYCDVCYKQCYSPEEFNRHCETIKHKHESNITMDCKVCNYSTTEKTKLERHFRTLKHQNAINGVLKKEGDYICESCNFKSKTQSKFKAHEESKKHQNAVNGIKQEESDLFCNLCNFKAMSNSAMNVHKESKKHQNAVAYEEKKLKDKNV